MPLVFESLSHGTIAFGFFNIDSDMLLLEEYFFFGSEFCEHIVAVAEGFQANEYQSKWPVYSIEDRSEIGDLMGAIHGIRHTGFIGELYRRYPFPKKPEDFKQKTNGFLSQAIVRKMISRYASDIQIPIVANLRSGEVDIGVYKFDRQTFQELIKYVWRGGYPGWQDDTHPDYVEKMEAQIEKHRRGLFENIQLG
ncbi:MAG: hypothetical protein KJP06_05830 [Deltaproteobacteria bacterium]|nr:hypothetical protein [Deltaproteobacteria bacterium]